MKLLINTTGAALFGPYTKPKQQISWQRVAFALVYVTAFVVLCLDVFVWRAA